MELIIFLLLIGLAGLAVYGLVTAGLLTHIGRNEKRALSDQDSILDEAFNGDSTVTIRVGAGHLPYGLVMKEASRRGYTFVSRDNGELTQELIFQKAV